MDPLPVRLRPFTESDLVLFDQYANDRELSEPFEWLGFTSSEPFRRRWQEDRLLGSSPYCLAVAAIDGDALVGWVDWRQNDRPGPGVWEVGVLIVPEMRGRRSRHSCPGHARQVLVLYDNSAPNLGGDRG